MAVSKATTTSVVAIQDVHEERIERLPEAMRRCRLRINGRNKNEGHRFLTAGVQDIETRGDVIAEYREVERCDYGCKTVRRRWVQCIPRWTVYHWTYDYDDAYHLTGLADSPLDTQYVIQEQQRAKHPELFAPDGKRPAKS